MSKFVHLHLHSHYSLLQALPKPKDIIKVAKEMGMDTFAITDNGTLYGIIETYQKCLAADMKLIIGMDAYLAPNGRHQKRARIDKKHDKIVLLAENNTGYLNLIKLSSIGFLEGFYYKPRIDKELLTEFCKGKEHGLIALSGGFMGDIDQALLQGKLDVAKELVQEYVEIFGKGNFYLELVDRPEIPEQDAVNADLIKLGKELDVPVVAAKNVSYLNADDSEAWKVLQCVQTGKTLEAYERMQQFDYNASFVDGEYMEERFKDIPEAIENTRVIADRCNVEITLGEWNFPKFDIPDGLTATEFLRKRAFAELSEKVEEVTEEMNVRLDYELNIIDMKGFSVYFLIVSDFIEWARRNGIVTTTRGSAAGSLVGFAVGISTINPILYKLPFERFLNPERPSAPDVDADFADNRRDEVLNYVRERYGEEKVAQICTFGTMLARGSVRDVGRVLGYPYSFVDQVAKFVPMGSQGFAMTLSRALDESPDLNNLYKTNPEVRRLVDLAKRIEGSARHVSVHAAGTVISPTELTDFTPLQIDNKEGKIISQYEMKSVEAAGLVKMDFLGIRNLSILGDAIRIVKRTKEEVIVLEDIPVDNKKTFELLAKGYTMGVFQLGGDGMTKYLMELKPERVEDIMAMVALYRPGPIESIPEYIKRKYDPSLVSFMDPRMKDILSMSYGVIVYQDDVMLISIKLGGYSWLEADKLRKAMGKKIPEEMAKQKEKLMKGLVENGMRLKKAQKLWKLIEPFAAYGFNKAHAASYGMIAYYTAYMKANYPTEYMAALMTAESNDLEKVSDAVKECERMDIAVLPPDINESLSVFTYINDDTIRFGLLVIKGLGSEVIATIINERDKNGPFVDLASFVTRVEHRAFNKKSLEALVKSGALDRFGERKELIENMDRILMFHKHVQLQKSQNQSSLFDFAPDLVDTQLSLRKTPPATKNERLAWEKELLGLYVSAHPYDEIEKVLRKHVISCEKVQAQEDGKFVRCAGLIASVKEIITKKGAPMAFVGIEDLHTKAEVIVFPRSYKQYKPYLEEGNMIVVSAKASKRDGEEVKLLMNSLVIVGDDNISGVENMLKSGMWIPAGSDEVPSQVGTEPEEEVEVKIAGMKTLDITLSGRPSHDLVDQLRSLFQNAPGPDRVCFLVESAGKVRRVKTDYTINSSSSVMQDVARLVGSNNVKIS